QLPEMPPKFGRIGDGCPDGKIDLIGVLLVDGSIADAEELGIRQDIVAFEKGNPGCHNRLIPCVAADVENMIEIVTLASHGDFANQRSAARAIDRIDIAIDPALKPAAQVQV